MPGYRLPTIRDALKAKILKYRCTGNLCVQINISPWPEGLESYIVDDTFTPGWQIIMSPLPPESGWNEFSSEFPLGFTHGKSLRKTITFYLVVNTTFLHILFSGYFTMLLINIYFFPQYIFFPPVPKL